MIPASKKIYKIIPLSEDQPIREFRIPLELTSITSHSCLAKHLFPLVTTKAVVCFISLTKNTQDFSVIPGRIYTFPEVLNGIST